MAPLGIQIAITAGSSSVAIGSSIIPNLLGSSEDFLLPATDSDPKNSNWDATQQGTTTTTTGVTETPPAAANRPGERVTQLNFLYNVGASGIVNNFRGNGNFYNLSGTEYTFSIWVKQVNPTDSRNFRLRVNRPGERKPALQNSTSGWTRHSITFTIGPGGDFSAGDGFVFNLLNVADDEEGTQFSSSKLYIFGAMLNEGATPAPYQYKDIDLPPAPQDPGANNPYLPNLITEAFDLEDGNVIMLSEEDIYLITES